MIRCTRYAAEDGPLARIGQANSRWGTRTGLGSEHPADGCGRCASPQDGMHAAWSRISKTTPITDRWIWRRGASRGRTRSCAPGKNDPAQSGKAGGEFPYGIAVRGKEWAYVSSVRDREIVAVNLAGASKVAARIAVHGEPIKMALNREETRLYVAEDNSDTLAVIDTSSNRVLGELIVTAPGAIDGEAWRIQGQQSK